MAHPWEGRRGAAPARSGRGRVDEERGEERADAEAHGGELPGRASDLHKL